MKKLIVITLIIILAVPARAQWTEPVRISEPGGCLYPQILAQGDTVHVAYSNNDQGWKIGYVRSTDGGDTWTDEQVLSEDSSETLFVRIIENAPKLIVLWRNNDYNGGIRPRNIGYNISNDDGLTWSGPCYVLNPNWSHILYFSASGSGPVINVILSSRINHELIFFDIRSTDFGQSWSDPAEIFTAAQSSLTDQVNFNDNIHFCWSGRFVWEGVWETYYLRSTDNGLTWSNNMILSEADQIISQLPAICANEDGQIACSWWDFKYSPYGTTGDILIRQSFDQGQTWLIEDQVTSEHRAISSDLCWARDSLFVAWQDWRFANLTIYYVSGPDSIHDWSNKQRLEDDPAESEDPAIAVSENKVFVVWADERCDPDTNVCGGIYFTRLDNQVGIHEEGEPNLPEKPSLDVYPNPFNSNATLSFKITKGGGSSLSIYDINGRLVKSIFKGGNLEKGTHKFTWDATDADGKDVSSGLYFAVAGTPQGKITKTLTLIR